tara:strand:- start:539 stop:643 length:105 start_codon:yes stop_codon:yes gene_type:complete
LVEEGCKFGTILGTKEKTPHAGEGLYLVVIVSVV